MPDTTSNSAKNMAAIVAAKHHHDANCPWGGQAQRVHMTFFDIERMGWEEGDVIAGLVVVVDGALASGRMRVSCDAEPDGGGRATAQEEQIADAVAPDRRLTPVEG